MTDLVLSEIPIYVGKSKEVFEIIGGDFKGKYAFFYSDRATGWRDSKTGEIHFDPGYDNVVGEIRGSGAISCKVAKFFFEELNKKGIISHYIATANDNTLIVEPAIPIGMKARSNFEGAAPLQNLEFTWRNQFMGSAVRRYPFLQPCGYAKNLAVEAWTKGKSDTLITFEVLEAAGVMTKKEISYTQNLVKDIAGVVTDIFHEKGLHVIDGKFELGRLKEGSGEIVLIDEISPAVLRVCNGYKPNESRDCLAAGDCIETRVIDNKLKIKAKNQVDEKEIARILGI